MAIRVVYITPPFVYFIPGIGASLLILVFIRSRMNDTRSRQEPQPENQDDTE